ncbi:MAG: trimethylamine methyltransferase family protein [Eubacteriales bacterium]
MNDGLMTEDLKKIHDATTRILENTGVQVKHPEALKIISQKGIRVTGETVFFTGEQIMEWVDKAPGSFTLYARNPRYNMTIGGDSIEYAPGYGAPTVAEFDGTKRPALMKDYVSFLMLSEQCDYFKCNGGVLVQPRDIGVKESGPLMLYATLIYSDKCIIGQPPGIGIDGNELLMDMLGIVFGGKGGLAEKPRIISIVNTTSPLILDKTVLDTMLVHSRYGQPLMISPCPMAGTTGPVTLAGTIALANAEALAGIAIAQMIKEGTPVMYGWQTSPADMKTGAIAIGSAERALMVTYGARLAKLYGLPIRGGGADTDAKCASLQSGYESMMTLLVSVQEKINLIIHSAGIVDGFASMSYDQFIADIEIIGMVERFVKGVEINEDTLAVDVINEVGPGGEYLTQDHTFEFCRKEHFSPEIGFRGPTEGPANERIFANIRKKKDAMLAAYQKPELPPAIELQLIECLAESGIDPKKFL